jgi:hypothetical protein
MTIYPLIPLSLSEAEWLHRNRHSVIAKTIVIAKNSVDADPLDPAKRIAWDVVIKGWRQSEEYPFFNRGGLKDV